MPGPQLRSSLRTPGAGSAIRTVTPPASPDQPPGSRSRATSVRSASLNRLRAVLLRRLARIDAEVAQRKIEDSGEGKR